MEKNIQVEPLSYKKRQKTFGFLVFIFLASLPFLYMYATGYRFDISKPTNFISTGGMYIAVDGTGAEIYIDGKLVRETRAFRRAFYAQNLDAGTHRIHVQKEGYHTWVKELPVSKRLVTEAEAFNLPLVPSVRVISEWITATGTQVIRQPLTFASSSNSVFATSTTATSTFLRNSEFIALKVHFGTNTPTTKETPAQQIKDLLRVEDATTTMTSKESTSTIIVGEVQLSRKGDDLYATWVGSFEKMPYYYCAPSFPSYSTATPETSIVPESLFKIEKPELLESGAVMHPVQTIPEGTVCEPTIRIDRLNQEVLDFDFLPGSTDFVLVNVASGIYVVEIDDRAWQNVQPLIVGKDLHMHIENGNIFVYDGALIYQVVLTVE